MLKKTSVLTGVLCALSVAALAQTPPQHQSLLGRLLHHKPATSATTTAPIHHSLLPFHRPMSSSMAGGTAAMSGRIIGNKKTHVYHMPGDSSLPAPQNRVYFSSAAAAQAAGYHASGSSHGSTTHHMKHQ